MKMSLTHLVQKNRKRITVSFMIMALFALSAVGCFATPATPSEQVISSFTGMKTDVMTILAAIGGIGISIYAVFLGWKYGKKIFNTVSK